jgi:hypothetical protein
MQSNNLTLQASTKIIVRDTICHIVLTSENDVNALLVDSLSYVEL